MKKSHLTTLIMLCIFFGLKGQTAEITKASGWLESAFVEWLPVPNALKYNVTYKSDVLPEKSVSDYLIRQYGTFYRVDIPGISAGKYSIQITPVFQNGPGTSTSIDTINVIAHDRSGFAFSNNKMPGAYKADGTPKDNAVIVYLTENNKNTVSLTVTGATTNPCIGLQNILDGFKKGKDNRPLIIRMIGNISDLTNMYAGDIIIENNNNINGCITFEGIGNDAVANGWGIRVKNASNIEIRNIGTMNCNSDEGDNIGLQQNNDYIWVHHCDFFYGNAGTDADQIKGDGALDCKKSTWITFSYNHFWDSGKSNLLGLSEGTVTGLYISYHHNWYDHSDSRHPRVRYYSAHVYNNYYDGNARYGAGATMSSSVFLEANYFRNCKYPAMISMQGTDVWSPSKMANDYVNMPTFSKEDGGIIKAFNNFMTGYTRFVPYGSSSFPNSTTDFDAVVVQNRNDTLNSSIVTYQGKTSYNNFDTNINLMYKYAIESPENAKDKIIRYAGRTENGDFKWPFTTADDSSSSVNAGLKNKLSSYQTQLISIQSEATSLTSTDEIYFDKNSFLIYPNPATDYLNIPADCKIVSINDLQGRKYDPVFQSTTQINLTGLYSGSYIISLQTNNIIHRQLFLKF